MVFVEQSDENWRHPEVVINTFVLHAPKYVVGCSQQHTEDSPIIEVNMNVDVVVLWIDLFRWTYIHNFT
jgi:hypothetical protein